MKNSYKILSYFLVIFVCFIIVDGVKAINDKGYVVCQYSFDIDIDGETKHYDPKIAVANANHKIYLPLAELDKFPSYTVTAFHKAGTSNYTCPNDIVFVNTYIGKENVTSGVKLPDGRNADPVNVQRIKFTPVPQKMSLNPSYSSKPSSKNLSVRELAHYDGKDFDESDCYWRVDGLANFPANNIAHDDSNYIRCDSTPNADRVDGIINWAKNETYKQKSYGDITCTNIINDKLAPQLKSGFFITCIIGLIILVFTMAGDFIKAIASGDADKMSETFKKSKNRIIASVILLLLPVLVNFIINFLNKNVTNIQTYDSDGNKVDSRLKVHLGDLSECGIVDKE